MKSDPEKKTVSVGPYTFHKLLLRSMVSSQYSRLNAHIVYMLDPCEFQSH